VRDGADTDAFNGTSAELNAWVASYAKDTPTRRDAAPNTSIRALAHRHNRTVQEVIWLTARHRRHGFGRLEREYITVGNWDRAMPVGMIVWA